MTDWIALLQVLLVATGSVAVLAFLISNLRYRKLELLARDEAASRPAISPAALVVQLLEEMRKRHRLLCRIQTPRREDASKVVQVLERHTRDGDTHSQVENGVVISRLDGSIDHARAVGERWIRLLRENGFPEGAVSVWWPEADPERLLDWVLRGDNLLPGKRLRLEVRVSEEAFAAGEPGESASVDPVTGVFRPDRVSRAIRRRLAEAKRTRGEMTLARISVPGTDGKPPSDGRMRQVAEILMAGCREEDVIGRSDDAEFVLLLSGEALPVAVAVRRLAALLRESVAAVRIGLSAMPEHGDNPGGLFERAGLALGWEAEEDATGVVAFREDMEIEKSSSEQARFLKEEF